MGHHDGVVDDTDGQPVDSTVLISAVEQAPVILLICEGPDLTVVGFNAELRALMPGREWVGRPLRDVFYELDGQQFMAQFNGVYETELPASGQQWRVHLDRPDGSVYEIFVNFTIAPWRWPDGTIRGVIGAGHDVTDMVKGRIAAEQQAEHLRERYEQTRDVVTALQQELLPPGLPVLPELQMAASYLLADADTAAGGDWYDAIVRPDGTIALIVGDVVGHGVTASGVMGQLRAVLQDRLHGGADLAEALDAADRFARQRTAARSTTVCVALLDPADGAVTYCTAGHPPPLLVTDGRARYLPGTGAGPLGTGGSFPVRTDRLGVGDLLLLYSDGILERPGRIVPAGSEELARVATDIAAGRAFNDPGATPADRICTQAVELLVRATGHADDITLLAAQRVPPAPPLRLELPAELYSLRTSRVAFGEWLDRIGVSSQDVFLLQHGLSELVTNAVEHAFGGDLGLDRVTVDASLSPRGVVEATVTDHGRWREPTRQETRGRGLALTSQLVESLRVEPTGTGTTATIRHLVSRPARMLTGDLRGGERPAPAPERVGITITELPGDDETRVRVAGALDAETAAGLRHELLRRSRGGTVPLDVDLTGVTHLASAGVSALHHVAERHTEQRAKLTLRALPGSPAEHVLALVALPHTTEPSTG